MTESKLIGLKEITSQKLDKLLDEVAKAIIQIAINEKMDTDLVLYAIASNLESFKLLCIEKSKEDVDVLEHIIQEARMNTARIYNMNKQQELRHIER